MYCAVGVVQPSGRSFSQLILGALEVLCSEPCFRPWVCPCTAPFVELKGNGSACIARSLWEAFASRSLTDALQHKRSSELGLQAACVRASELQGCCSHWGRRNGKCWLILSTLKHSTPSPTCHATNPKHGPARILLRAPRAGDPGPCQLLDTQPGLLYLLVPRRNLGQF